MKLIISVTQKNIREGVRQQGDLCLVALAIKAKGVTLVNVGDSSAEGYYKGSSFFADLTKRAKAFVRRFDKSEEVRPFQFILNIK